MSSTLTSLYSAEFKEYRKQLIDAIPVTTTVPSLTAITKLRKGWSASVKFKCRRYDYCVRLGKLIEEEFPGVKSRYSYQSVIIYTDRVRVIKVIEFVCTLNDFPIRVDAVSILPVALENRTLKTEVDDSIQYLCDIPIETVPRIRKPRARYRVHFDVGRNRNITKQELFSLITRYDPDCNTKNFGYSRPYLDVNTLNFVGQMSLSHPGTITRLIEFQMIEEIKEDKVIEL